jgi:hypothetical protein
MARKTSKEEQTAKHVAQASVRVDVAEKEERRRGFRRKKGIQDAVTKKGMEKGHWMDEKNGDCESEDVSDVKKRIHRPDLLL